MVSGLAGIRSFFPRLIWLPFGCLSHEKGLHSTYGLDSYYFARFIILCYSATLAYWGCGSWQLRFEQHVLSISMSEHGVPATSRLEQSVLITSLLGVLVQRSLFNSSCLSLSLSDIGNLSWCIAIWKAWRDCRMRLWLAKKYVVRQICPRIGAAGGF